MNHTCPSYQTLLEFLQTILACTRQWPTDATTLQEIRETLVGLGRIVGRAPLEFRQTVRNRLVIRFLKSLGEHPEWWKAGGVIETGAYFNAKCEGIKPILDTSRPDGLKAILFESGKALKQWTNAKMKKEKALPLIPPPPKPPVQSHKPAEHQATPQVKSGPAEGARKGLSGIAAGVGGQQVGDKGAVPAKEDMSVKQSKAHSKEGQRGGDKDSERALDDVGVTSGAKSIKREKGTKVIPWEEARKNRAKGPKAVNRKVKGKYHLNAHPNNPYPLCLRCQKKKVRIEDRDAPIFCVPVGSPIPCGHCRKIKKGCTNHDESAGKKSKRVLRSPSVSSDSGSDNSSEESEEEEEPFAGMDTEAEEEVPQERNGGMDIDEEEEGGDHTIDPAGVTVNAPVDGEGKADAQAQDKRDKGRRRSSVVRAGREVKFAGTASSPDGNQGVVGTTQADGILQTEGNLEAGGDVGAGGKTEADSNLEADGELETGGEIQAGGEMEAGGGMKAGGKLQADGGMEAGGELQADGGMWAGSDVEAGGVQAGGQPDVGELLHQHVTQLVGPETLQVASAPAKVPTAPLSKPKRGQKKVSDRLSPGPKILFYHPTSGRRLDAIVTKERDLPPDFATRELFDIKSQQAAQHTRLNRLEGEQQGLLAIAKEASSNHTKGLASESDFLRLKERHDRLVEMYKDLEEMSVLKVNSALQYSKRLEERLEITKNTWAIGLEQMEDIQAKLRSQDEKIVRLTALVEQLGGHVPHDLQLDSPTMNLSCTKVDVEGAVNIDQESRCRSSAPPSSPPANNGPQALQGFEDIPLPFEECRDGEDIESPHAPDASGDVAVNAAAALNAAFAKNAMSSPRDSPLTSVSSNLTGEHSPHPGSSAVKRKAVDQDPGAEAAPVHAAVKVTKRQKKTPPPPSRRSKRIGEGPPA
ncbi:hypothetical protein BKA70DRAFT_1227819 [Coprinopsis sp. MPI-PUGE-AT-0042]|nr:hypothetical protein BKA70DRAFT_1227819 [Coprinopsis sp. MPI-PUGE-AT-0042]